MNKTTQKSSRTISRPRTTSGKTALKIVRRRTVRTSMRRKRIPCRKISKSTPKRNARSKRGGSGRL
jgi:hypothetical protein